MSDENGGVGDRGLQLSEIVELYNQGKMRRLYIVAQGDDGMVSEYDFKFCHQSAADCSLLD